MLYRINAGVIPGDSWIQRDEGGGRIVGEVDGSKADEKILGLMMANAMPEAAE